jgi:hypothetical protein
MQTLLSALRTKVTEGNCQGSETRIEATMLVCRRNETDKAGIRTRRELSAHAPVTSRSKIVQPGPVYSRVVTRVVCRSILDQESDCVRAGLVVMTLENLNMQN